MIRTLMIFAIAATLLPSTAFAADEEIELSTTFTVGENRLFGPFGLTAFEGTYQQYGLEASRGDFTVHGYAVRPEGAQEAGIGVSYAHEFENGIEVGGGYSFVVFDMSRLGQDAHIVSLHVSDADGFYDVENWEVGWTASTTFLWSRVITDAEVYDFSVSSTYTISPEWDFVSGIGYSVNTEPSYNGMHANAGLEWSPNDHITVGGYATGFSGSTSENTGFYLAVTISN